MNFQFGREAINEMLGSDSHAKGRPSTEDLFTTTLTNAPRVHKTYRNGYDRQQLPLVVVPSDSDFDEFFATVATYYSGQVPITAYMHVIGEELERFIDEDRATPVFDDGSSTLLLSLIGASLGETTLAALHGGDNAPVTSYSSCRRSLSYVMARTTALYPKLEPRNVADRWQRLRRLTGLPVSQIAVEAVVTTHAIAVNSKNFDRQASLPKMLRSPLGKQLRGADRGEALRDILVDTYPRLTEAFTSMSGPFDSRMAAFLSGVREIQSLSHGPEVDSVAVAFLCNSILPGSFAHSKVLTRLVEFFPSALVWYGVFSATSSEFDVRNFGNGIAFKLMRDLAQPFSFSDRPQCDLSLDEFEVLARGAIKPEAIKPSQVKTAVVALLPGVDVLSRVMPEDEVVRYTERDDVGAERLEHATRLVEEASSLLREIAYERDRKISGPSFAKRRKR
ncbi:hypothetical protein [Roseateles sp. PN1]|uniref:hypothetical protein n=1 Tax=Roseateles sp. PN1 TaxID=3137372 RepID=UPI0031390B42